MASFKSRFLDTLTSIATKYRRCVALGIVGTTVWLGATFGIVYAAVDLAGEDTQIVVEAPQAEDRECAEAVVYFSTIDNAFQFFLGRATEQGTLDELRTLGGFPQLSDYTDALNQMIAACSR